MNDEAFRTIVDPGTIGHPIKHKDRVMLVGSCFSEHIGKKLVSGGFDVKINPFGIIFHPNAMVRVLLRALDGREFSKNDLVESEGTWRSLEAHSQWQNADRDRLIQELNEELRITRKWLENSPFLILTFGTAWGYVYRDSDRVVANCHKLAQDQFEKTLFTSQEMYDQVKAFIDRLQVRNPNVKVITTVSPVRHWKDGARGNALSKSNLLLLAHLLSSPNKDKAEYFPAYEIMMDDLRDYRFFDRDMLHPNQTAVEYIWKRFAGFAMDESTRKLAHRIGGLSRIFEHRSDSADHQAKVEETRQQIQDLLNSQT
ncbi:MAG: GSCFA domain-containing protein [Flavobacteriales bacterium]|nr:GSCFA domain-containing protein [Flavobacteriales bacterium]